jgi:hypothetical protein
MRNRLPKPTESRSGSTDHARIFKPVEHAILAEFFVLPELLPDWAKGVGLGKFPLEDWDETLQGIAPLGPIHDHNVLENAVARIALAPIQGQLPQWAAYDSNHTIFARTVREFPERDATSHPLLLFGINWATSGPGFSWPEDYYVTWIPHYDRYVVTASSDSKDVHGFEDIALGFFQGGAGEGNDRERIESIITGYWTGGSDVQSSWEDIWKEGAIDEVTALRWRKEVWHAEEENENEEKTEESDES